MMKKFLVLLLSIMMVFSLAACGGDDKTGGNDQQVENNVDQNNDADNDVSGDAIDDADNDTETSGDYTDEQAAYVEKYNQMLTDYQAAIDLANATPELAGDTELADMMNE